MKVKVNQDLCIGCALCSELAPEVFSFRDYKSEVKTDLSLDSKEQKELVRTIVKSCPVSAIKIST